MKNITATLMLVALLWLISHPISVFAQDYQHGHGALQIFDAKALEITPTWVRVWISFMLLSFVCSLFFIKNHATARWVAACFVAGIVFMLFIAPQFGIVPLSGFIALCHLIFWSPALYQLLKAKAFLGPRTPFSIWSGLITGVIIFSFVFDLRDAFIYLRHIS